MIKCIYSCKCIRYQCLLKMVMNLTFSWSVSTLMDTYKQSTDQILKLNALVKIQN